MTLKWKTCCVPIFFLLLANGGAWGATAPGSAARAGAIGPGVNPGRASAAYLLNANSLVWIEQKVTKSNPVVGDFYGNAVAIDGDTAVIGAYEVDVDGHTQQGAAYVFTRTNGTWNEAQMLTASGSGEQDHFGYAVAIDGDRILVGAPEVDIGGDSNQGAVYVFTRSNGGWSEAQTLTAGDGAAGDYFGDAVALDGDRALIGAMWADVGGKNAQGEAYVFDRANGSWSEAAALTASDGGGGDNFGFAVSVDGDTAVVGAPLFEGGGPGDQGAAYVFTRTNGNWSEMQALTASDARSDDFFGDAVAVAGNTVLGGARWADFTHTDEGGVYVYIRSNGVWNQMQTLTASDGTYGDFFGYSVAIDGDRAVIGAPRADIDGDPHQGAAYLFTRSNGSWSEVQKVTASDGEMDDEFAAAVALSGSTALAGMRWAGGFAQGAAYFYGGSDLALAVSAP
ncbi:MAG: FG-GAP repeat protein, partial [Gammaproteobacteria bacterium]|nr:FG-GAP repeat protein [Gammaproteobacteria bacterium]